MDSTSLKEFRNWAVEDAGMTINPAVCIINGEYNDGTKSAPSFETSIAPPANSSNGGTGAAATAAAAAATSPMGCQVYTAREVKKGENIITCPRSAMVTPDLIAASDAGRAVLACCKRKNSSSNVDGTGTGTGSDGDGGKSTTNYWDVFENTVICENKVSQKMANNAGTQMLVSTLRQRDRAERAYKTKMESINNNNTVELADSGVISTRAPFLAFLIHQRFASQSSPPVMSSGSNSDFEVVLSTDGDANAIKDVDQVPLMEGTPSSFGPYACTMPSTVPLPINWKRNELALLTDCVSGSSMLKSTVATTTQLANEYIALINAGILSRFPSTFTPEMMTWSNWVWAASMYTSRVLPVSCYLDTGMTSATELYGNDGDNNKKDLNLYSPPEVWDELGVFIPFMDMVNHEIEAKSIRWEQSISEKSVSMDEDGDDGSGTEGSKSHPPQAVATKRVRKHQQLYFDYGGGSLANEQCIIQYGFAQLLNKCDVVEIGWGLIDGVGNVSRPVDYESMTDHSSEDGPYLVYESNDGTAINEWWSDDRLKLLEKEAFSSVGNSFMSDLKLGKRMVSTAHFGGKINPLLLTAIVVATMPEQDLQQVTVRGKSDGQDAADIVITQRHQRVLRNYLLFMFSRKLEKLLGNLSSGLKSHYPQISHLWTKAAENGIFHKPEKDYDGAHIESAGADNESEFGWQTIFDQYAYATTMEVEKHYYALSPGSCVLTLYDGHLRSLQATVNSLLSREKFQDGVVKQLEELGYGIGTDDGTARNPVSSDDMNGAKGGGRGSDRERGSRKDDSGRSPKRKRNRNRNRRGDDRPPALKLHVGNLSYTTVLSELYDYFIREYGRDNVLECHIPTERATGKSRGFGFVTMPEHVARQVLSSGRKLEISGRVLRIAESNSLGTGKSSSRPYTEVIPPQDRCNTCGYRPKYCVCQNGPTLSGGAARGGGPGPGGPGHGEPPRDFDYYGRDSRRDRRYSSRSPSPYGRRGSRGDRDDDYRDSYGRDRDRRSYDYDDMRRDRSRSRSSSRDRGRDRSRDRKRDRKDRDRDRRYSGDDRSISSSSSYSRGSSRGRDRDRSRDRKRDRDRDRSSRDRDRYRDRDRARDSDRSKDRSDRRDRGGDRHIGKSIDGGSHPSPTGDAKGGVGDDDEGMIDDRMTGSVQDGDDGGVDEGDEKSSSDANRKRRSRSRSRDRDRDRDRERERERSKKNRKKRRRRDRSHSRSP
mmetsp:Transcript_5631/g.13632  ORF Transcript_5631/g.13632 Transcript_5631/m.13632 type:complete len:1217 (-) Transcript_5631:167-3817(-)